MRRAGCSLSWARFSSFVPCATRRDASTEPRMSLVFTAGRIAMSHFDLRPPTEAQRGQISAGLDQDEQRVLLEHGTEAAFCGVFLDNHKDGIYSCRFCGFLLFMSGAQVCLGGG